MIEKCLSFEIEGELGFFKIPNASSSKLTYQIIPKTAINGLVSAIIGKINEELDFTKRNNYLKFFGGNNSFVAVELIKPIQKINMGINYRNIKSFYDTTAISKKEGLLLEDVGFNYDKDVKQSPTSVEFLKNPKYRIYFYHTKPLIYNTLKERLEREETYFPYYLGHTDAPAIIRNYKEISIQEYRKEDLEKKHTISGVNDEGQETLLVKMDSTVFLENAYFPAEDQIYLNQEIFSFEDYIVEKQALDFKMKNGNKMVTEFKEIVGSTNGVYSNLNKFYRTELDTNIFLY